MIAVILRDIHTLSLERSSHPPSPSIPSHLSQLQELGHSPDILVTSLTSPLPFPPLHGTSHSHSANRAGLLTLMIPTVPAYALYTPSSSPTAADLPGSCFGVGRGFGTRAHSHPSQPSITLTPDDDDEHSECKRARMEGAVGVEGNSGVGIGVAGTGGTEMDMTTDSKEDSKLTPLCRLLVLHTHVRRVTLRRCGLLAGMEVCLIILERPLRRTGSVAGAEATTTYR